jgi:hypothetical protein
VGAGETLAAFERAAEAAYAAMYDAQPYAVKDHYDDARANFARAIDCARRNGSAAEADRLSQRLEHLRQVYDRQFRGVGR